MNRYIAHAPAMASVDLVNLAGPRMRALYDALPEARRGFYAETATDLAERVAELVAIGDIVLVKGSKGSRISTVVDALRRTRQSSAPGERTA